MDFPNKKYNIIYADPPWDFKNKKTGGSMVSGAASQYKTMKVYDICRLPVDTIAADDCVLLIWWVATQPLEALKVMEAWGFKLKTMKGFEWVKRTKNWKLDFGMGFSTRAGSESCLIAHRGKPKRVSAGVRAVVEARHPTKPSGKILHSAKPSIFADEIVKLYGDIPRIELFARDKKDGWDSWGDELGTV